MDKMANKYLANKYQLKECKVMLDRIDRKCECGVEKCENCLLEELKGNISDLRALNESIEKAEDIVIDEAARLELNLELKEIINCAMKQNCEENTSELDKEIAGITATIPKDWCSGELAKITSYEQISDAELEVDENKKQDNDIIFDKIVRRNGKSSINVEKRKMDSDDKFKPKRRTRKQEMISVPKNHYDKLLAFKIKHKRCIYNECDIDNEHDGSSNDIDYSREWKNLVFNLTWVDKKCANPTMPDTDDLKKIAKDFDTSMKDIYSYINDITDYYNFRKSPSII